MPANAAAYYIVLAQLADMDPADGSKFFEKLGLKETKPPVAAWEHFGIDSSSFFLLSGPIFVILAFILAFAILNYVLARIAAKFPRIKTCRRIGIWAQ